MNKSIVNRIIGWFTLISLAFCWGVLVPNLWLDLIGGVVIGIAGAITYYKLTGERLSW